MRSGSRRRLAGATGSAAAWIAADTVFHADVVRAAGNAYLTALYEGVHTAVLSQEHELWVRTEAEPGWLAGLNSQAGHLLAGHGALFALLAAVIEVAVGWCVLRPPWRRTALAAGIAVAILYGVFGQDLGGLLTGQATDPGTAPLFVLLTLALWPQRHSATPTPTTTAG